MKKHNQSGERIHQANMHVMRQYTTAGHLYIYIETLPIYLIPKRSSLNGRNGGLR